MYLRGWHRPFQDYGPKHWPCLLSVRPERIATHRIVDEAGEASFGVLETDGCHGELMLKWSHVTTVIILSEFQ
jgi:hypothetical protein